MLLGISKELIMGKFRLKTGFTLAEALIAMAIIGVVMALLLRALNRAQPDKEKMMYSKSYHTLETVVYETINDYTKYDQDIYADEHADFSQDPLEINGDQAYVEIKGTKYNVTKDNALCYYAAEKLNTIGDINCSAGATTLNFTTTNGVEWYGLGGGTYPKTVSIDINGAQEDGRCDRTNGCEIIVYADGQVGVPDNGLEEGYLKTQTNLNNKNNNNE